jgi:hypothetical protein
MNKARLRLINIATAVPDPSSGTDIAFTAKDDPTPLVLDSNGTLTITNPPLGTPVWGTDWIQIPAGKKLVVKWEYLPLADGTLMQASGGSYNNESSVMIGNGGGAAWKYFQTRRPIGSDAVGYFRYQGTGSSPADNTAAIGIDMLNSEFRMETEHTSTDPAWGHRIYTVTMKIRPVGGTTSFDELNDYSQTGNGYFYKESTYNSSHDLAVIWLSGYTQVMDSQGNFRIFKYLRYELVDAT